MVAARAVIGGVLCHTRGPAAVGDFPAGSITELVSADGTVAIACVVPSGTSVSTASPVLPKSLPNAGEGTPYRPFTVEGTGGVAHYRMTDWPENSFGGQYVVFAIPLTPVESTLSQLLLLEALISARLPIRRG